MRAIDHRVHRPRSHARTIDRSHARASPTTRLRHRVPDRVVRIDRTVGFHLSFMRARIHSFVRASTHRLESRTRVSPRITVIIVDVAIAIAVVVVVVVVVVE